MNVRDAGTSMSRKSGRSDRMVPANMCTARMGLDIDIPLLLPNDPVRPGPDFKNGTTISWLDALLGLADGPLPAEPNRDLLLAVLPDQFVLILIRARGRIESRSPEDGPDLVPGHALLDLVV